MAHTLAPSFGTQLRQLRERASLSQAQLAAAISVSRQWINRVEADEEIPTLTRVDELVRALTELQPSGDAFLPSFDRDELHIRLTAAACDARVARWCRHLAAREAALREYAHVS